MKKLLLRKLYILMLAVTPALAAGNISASAAETASAVSASEEVNLPEEEADLPEETKLPQDSGEAEAQEDTNLPQDSGEAEAQEDTNLPQDSGEAEAQEDTNLSQDSGEAEAQEEIKLPQDSGEAEAREETNLPQDSGEAETPEEIKAPEGEEETELTEHAAQAESGEESALIDETGLTAKEGETAEPAETEAGITADVVSEEKQILNTGAAEILKNGINARMVDRIHYITLNDTDAASDSILIESAGHYGLIDASHPSWDPDSRISGYTADVDDVIDYLHRVGVMHLDFVLGTHSHSDHIGGMKFLASAQNTEGNCWIDSNTVYYYKQQYYNQLEEGDWGWQNSRMFRQSVEAMKERGAIMVETSAHNAEALEKAKAEFVKGGSDPVSDSIEFMIGNLAVSFFNLYHNSSDNENLNSIVTAVRKDDLTSLLMGDLEMEDGYERRVANAVAAKYGNADVIKLAHHGYDQCTSSDMLRTLNPSSVVTTSNRFRDFYDDEPPFNYFLAHRGITAYRAAENGPALVEDMTGDEIRFLTYDRSGSLTEEPVEWKARMTAGWKKWNRDDGTYDYIFIHEDGSAATGWNWLSRNGKACWYLFDQDGVNLRGFQKVGQDTYYLNDKGEMQTDWQYVGGKWYYMNGSGAVQTGWRYLGGSWYYMNASGAMQTGWQYVGGKWYYMNGSGAMQTGWQYLGGRWYYLDGSGAAQTGWCYLGGSWYYMNARGTMQTGWQYVGGKWYYMNGSGAMQTGWQYVGGKWYYLDGSGAMQTGWRYLGGKWYYLDGSGAMQTGWQYISGKWYYMNGSGAMQTGWQYVGGKWYYMDASGAMQTGWRYLGGTWYYMNASGAMQTGWQYVGGKWYYMDGSGAMRTGYVKVGGSWYHLGSDGAWISG